ncbi:MAG: anthranilate phosphoribosyltransferase [FCB group bacterium]|nr:anthranilate phosphoribosyltransferase [FCB group bacterium]
MIKKFIRKVTNKENLTVEEATQAMDIIMDGKATSAQIAGLIIALKLKGENIDDVSGFVKSMRKHSLKVKISNEYAVDGCGTGGDGSHSFNISTAAALVASAAGVTVAKHGNRSISSKCGSADLLKKAGGKIDLSPEKVERNLQKIGFGFMFAPRFHPAMKYAAAPRRELGVRTIFNILGPMTNPASVKRQLVGVFDKKLLPLVAEVLMSSGSKHVITAHSRDGLDEFSVSAPTDYFEMKNGSVNQVTLSPEDVGLSSYPPKVLCGGDADKNLNILNDVLNGKKSSYRDAVLLNSGVLLYLGKKAEDIKEGVILAEKAIDNSAAKQKLSDWIRESNR